MDNTIIIPNITEFNQRIIDGNLVLTRIIPYISEEELFLKCLTKSIILGCKINDTDTNFKKYKPILIYLYSTIDRDTILNNTILNISQYEIHIAGFQYYADLRLSIQGASSPKTLKEIIKMIRIKNYSMELKIKLKNDEIVYFKI